MQLSDFRDKHKGEDIFVICSGRTMEFYDPDFFTNRITVGINSSWELTLPSVTYAVTKYEQTATHIRDTHPETTVIMTKHNQGQYQRPICRQPGLVIANHNNNRVDHWNPKDWPRGKDSLVVSKSTITTAMHFSTYIGAKSIFLVANDIAEIDDMQNVKGHKSEALVKVDKKWDLQNRQTRDELVKRYGVTIYSLLPFTSPNMDGHKFKSFAGVLNAK